MPSIKELSALPAPDVVEELSFDDIFSAVLTEFKTSCPDFSAFLESDPAIKVLEVAAYRAMLLRNRVGTPDSVSTWLRGPVFVVTGFLQRRRP